MSATPVFYNVEPGIHGLDRLDYQDIGEPWSAVREQLQGDLAPLDKQVRDVIADVAVRSGSNQGGRVHLFVYRAYEAPGANEIDPVVVSVVIRPAPRHPSFIFEVSGDIAGELSGDILFECGLREAIGWQAMIEAARDISVLLVTQAKTVADALKNDSRRV